MATISQTTFWNRFSSMKKFEFGSKFPWGLFLRGQYVSKDSGNGLVPNRRPAISWMNVDQGKWQHMSSVGHSELTIPVLSLIIAVEAKYWKQFARQMSLAVVRWLNELHCHYMSSLAWICLNGASHLVAIVWTVILVPCHLCHCKILKIKY